MPIAPPSFEIKNIFATTSEQSLHDLLNIISIDFKGRFKRELLADEIRAASWEYLDNDLVRHVARDEEILSYFRATVQGVAIIASVQQHWGNSHYNLRSFDLECTLQERFNRMCAEVEAERLEHLQEIQIGGRSVRVEFAPGLQSDSRITWKAVRDCDLLRKYAATMDPRFVFEKITVQSVDFFGSRIGFLKISAMMKDETGQRVPGVAFLRGGSVAILVVLHTLERDYIAVVKQARSAVGKYALAEIPAGMLDGSGNFVGKAAQELYEEFGISIKREQLIDLTELAGFNQPGVFTSPGGSDEFLRIMLYRQAMSDEERVAYVGRKTGVHGENESLVTDLVPLDDLSTLPPDGKTLTALFLYERLVKLGKI